MSALHFLFNHSIEVQKSLSNFELLLVRRTMYGRTDVIIITVNVTKIFINVLENHNRKMHLNKVPQSTQCTGESIEPWLTKYSSESIHHKAKSDGGHNQGSNF